MAYMSGSLLCRRHWAAHIQAVLCLRKDLSVNGTYCAPCGKQTIGVEEGNAGHVLAVSIQCANRSSIPRSTSGDGEAEASEEGV